MNAKMKAENESMKQQLQQLTRENDELRSAGPLFPNKPAKATDVESRLSDLEAYVEMLKQERLTAPKKRRLITHATKMGV